jgi:hypothetical protein
MFLFLLAARRTEACEIDFDKVEVNATGTARFRS